MISMQAPVFRSADAPESNRNETVYAQHPWWATGTGWKHMLNNVRLIIQPYICCCWLAPWLRVFAMPMLRESFGGLKAAMNHFRCYVPI